MKEFKSTNVNDVACVIAILHLTVEIAYVCVDIYEETDIDDVNVHDYLPLLLIIHCVSLTPCFVQ